MVRKKILAKDLVPGDIVKLEEGDDIPADIRVIAATTAQADQSSLTGEVNPVHKGAHAVKDTSKKNHADLNNMIFSGTNMMKGNITGVVVKTGMSTDFGKIAELTQNVAQQKSPLESDKTGTLTKNEMTVKELWTLEKSYHVSGEGYAVRGHIKEGRSIFLQKIMIL